MESEADELLYGGAAGGGKTYLMCGLAATRHERSILFRRESTQLTEIEDVLEEWAVRSNRNQHRFYLPGGRVAECGYVQREHDWKKYKGRPHDLVAFDELTDFSRSLYRTLIIWARTTAPGQRVRVIGATNPPVTAEQAWVIEEWAPWLDRNFDDPAEPGELRWYVYDEQDELMWLRSGEPVEVAGEMRDPKSRTFIPAKIDDNPALLATGYKQQLDALPEELRRAFKLGEFTVHNLSDPFQVIPTEWVLAAQARWKEGRSIERIEALAVDPSRGGKDDTVLAAREGARLEELIVEPGKRVPDGPAVAALIAETLGDEQARVIIDVIGIGSSVYDSCEANAMDVQAFNAAERSDYTDNTGKLRFVNQRAEWYWRLREALDPDTGDDLELPPDDKLLRQLCAHHWKLTVRGVQIESKDDVRKKLGESPDRADAVMMAFVEPDLQLYIV